MSVRHLSGFIRGLGRSQPSIRTISAASGAGAFASRVPAELPRIAVMAALSIPFVLAACGGDESRPIDIPNNAPRVTGFFLDLPRAHAAEDLRFTVTAVDDDGDQMQFRWFATRGSFPLGRGQRSVIWRSPRSRGIDTLSVVITDFQDSVVVRKIVDLVLPTPPGDLSHVNSTSLVDIRWDPSSDENIENWAGYQLFRGTASLVGVTDDQLDQYLVTPEPVRVHLVRISGLDAGERYYFHARSVRSYDGLLERSDPTPEFHMSPRPGGPVSGFGEFSSSASAAFDLSEGRVRPLDADDPSEVAQRDFYIGTTDEFDERGDLVLKSISELANRDPAWGERVVQIKQLGVDNWNVATTEDAGWSTQALIEPLGVYALKTPEGNFAKIWITGVSLFPPERIVTLVWAYQTIPNYASF